MGQLGKCGLLLTSALLKEVSGHFYLPELTLYYGPDFEVEIEKISLEYREEMYSLEPCTGKVLQMACPGKNIYKENNHKSVVGCGEP